MSGFRRGLLAVGSAFMTLLLHGLLLGVVLWSDGGPSTPRLPDAVGAGANFGSAVGNPGERMILIQLTPELTLAPEPAKLGQLTLKIPEPTMLQVSGPDVLPPKPIFASADGEEMQTSEADLIARTRLAGLYEGQIRARIERAWLRPRDSLPEEAFACRARVHQDATGAVIGVELSQCNGTARWQQSLITAIYVASPLPAPPSEAVFVDAFSLSFQAATYREDSPIDGYESPGRLLVSRLDPAHVSQASSQTTVDMQKQAPNGIVYINGTSKGITWSTQAPTVPPLQGLNPIQDSASRSASQ